MANGVWTNNWRGYKNAMLLGAVHDGLTTMHVLSGDVVPNNSPVSSGIRPLSPFSRYDRINSDLAVSESATSFFPKTCLVILGTGSGTPAAADVDMFTRINNYTSTGLNQVSISAGAVTWGDSEDATSSRTITLNLYNGSANPITITEWGLVGSLLTETGSAYPNIVQYNYRKLVLLYHEMLDAAVTLASAQSATMELSLSIELSDPV